MRPYSEHPDVSISMADTPELRHLLENTFREERISHVLETGTYNGLGSTRVVAESFPAGSPPQIFLTIEINWLSWCQAKKNLRRFSFVRPLWGRSVPLHRALRFINSDEALRNHIQYPDVFIDDTQDPVRFYHDELLGHLGGTVSDPMARLRQAIDRIFYYAGNNLLEEYLKNFCSVNPLIILDSAGGIGFLEFSIVERIMRPYPYLLLLDDVNHIKHFRSYRHIEKDSHFRILQVNENDGWLFARHTC